MKHGLGIIRRGLIVNTNQSSLKRWRKCHTPVLQTMQWSKSTDSETRLFTQTPRPRVKSDGPDGRECNAHPAKQWDAKISYSIQVWYDLNSPPPSPLSPAICRYEADQHNTASAASAVEHKRFADGRFIKFIRSPPLWERFADTDYCVGFWVLWVSVWCLRG